jgi:hypothetical protein
MNKFSWAHAITVYYIICGVFGLIFMIKSLEKESTTPRCSQSELARPEIPRCELIRIHKI